VIGELAGVVPVTKRDARGIGDVMTETVSRPAA
jgi:hypothetical protein